MRRQARPFTVEIKQKRNHQKGSRSIWGDIDFSAAVAETTKEFQEVELPNGQLVDSNVIPLDAEHLQEPRAEYLMSDPTDAQSVEVATEPAPEVETPATEKKVPRSRKAKAKPALSHRKNRKAASPTDGAPVAPARTGRKIYSDKERAAKLAQIEKSVSGGATLKNSVKQAAISEQTYYHWKKAASPASDGDDLKDLVALEEENKRLKRLLAERLRKENAELKKKLGMA